MIDIEQKGCELISCRTHHVTLNCDLELGFSKSNFEIALFQPNGRAD